MKWKNIVAAVLRILWMLRPKLPEGEGLKGSKVQGVRKVVSPNMREDKSGQAFPRTRPMGATLSNLSNQATMRSASDVIAAEHVGATYSSNCSKLLPRSQVLSLLQWDCRRSARKIRLLVLHCSDTRPDQDYTIEKLMTSHRARGFGTYPGYHLYVRRDGTLYYTRPVNIRGCHVKSFNSQSLGICYEGGHSCSPEQKYEDNRTAEQMVVLDELFKILHAIYPEARIVGHCELNPRKACPCLAPPASVEYSYIFNHHELEN